ncbi:hypothetical protein OAB13_00990 [Salibacteraceae bacterium]|mgnify:CR=1 FL=1|nr:hypothetical protein [Salibacteraceae bacterium]
MITKLRLLLVVLVFCMGSNGCKEQFCDDTCFWPADGECDDGGPDSVNDYCQFGTDCTDCGTRTEQ